MAVFEKSMKLLEDLEFNSPRNVLHKNKTESAYTYYGIYRKAHPYWRGWLVVVPTADNADKLSEASVALFANEGLRRKVYDFYKTEFYRPLRLTEIHNQHIADEIFIFAVNAGHGQAIKAAQTAVGVEVDGIIGKDTLRALNAIDTSYFDKMYDRMEMKYYEELIARKPKFKIYANGWRNRAEYV